ncbi:MAG: zinc ABC transporter substrate-binding protein, partial [Nitriliruptoraceae bacterium]|nr:zinc ABC transporter substrate-binding protein [Nitriliruptoraceae bacterium]
SARTASSRALIISLTLPESPRVGVAPNARTAARALDVLHDLERTIRDGTVTIPASNRTLIAYHDAWTYFARDHGLDFVALQPGDYAEPSASEVRALIDLVRERRAPAVFGSEEFPTPVLAAIAEETDATYVTDLADDVLPGSPGDPEHTYVELMRRNAASIVGSLGGDASGIEAWSPPAGG